MRNDLLDPLGRTYFHCCLNNHTHVLVLLENALLAHKWRTLHDVLTTAVGYANTS